MVMWESSQWPGMNVVRNNGIKKNSRKAWICALPAEIMLKTALNSIHSINQSINHLYFQPVFNPLYLYFQPVFNLFQLYFDSFFFLLLLFLYLQQVFNMFYLSFSKFLTYFILIFNHFVTYIIHIFHPVLFISYLFSVGFLFFTISSSLYENIRNKVNTKVKNENYTCNKTHRATHKDARPLHV